jgi:hypothetical protein
MRLGFPKAKDQPQASRRAPKIPKIYLNNTIFFIKGLDFFL